METLLQCALLLAMLAFWFRFESKNKKLGDISAQLERLPDLQKIQEALSHSQQKAIHQFSQASWRHQTSFALRRDAYVRYFNSLVNSWNSVLELNYVTDTHLNHADELIWSVRKMLQQTSLLLSELMLVSDDSISDSAKKAFEAVAGYGAQVEELINARKENRGVYHDLDSSIYNRDESKKFVDTLLDRLRTDLRTGTDLAYPFRPE